MKDEKGTKKSLHASPSILTLRRYGYSGMPWRLAWITAEGPWQEGTLPGVWWRRRQDGQPTLKALQALGLDWSRSSQWMEAERAAVSAILGPLMEAEEHALGAMEHRVWDRERPPPEEDPADA